MERIVRTMYLNRMKMDTSGLSAEMNPDATLTAKGFTQLSSATDSVSETLAATPKAIKAAYDLARGKYTAQDATTGQKGIVQLSSATDSASEALAATPKAVKTVSDDLIKLRNSQGTAATKNAQEAPDDITPGSLSSGQPQLW